MLKTVTLVFFQKRTPTVFAFETKHDKAIRVTLKLSAGRGSQAEAGGGASSADGGLVVSWSQVSYIIYICSCIAFFQNRLSNRGLDFNR
jgi:hypothetical protein